MRDRFYSTADLARVCGVSISTIKRWTDSGILRCVRTPGGHRKYRVQDVAEAARRLGLAGVDADARPAAQLDELALLLLQGNHAAMAARIADALRAGDAITARQIVLDLHRHGMRLAEAAALVVRATRMLQTAAPGADLDVFVVRRAEQTAATALRSLLDHAVPAPADAPAVLVTTAPGTREVLAATLVQLVLIERGWRVVDLGPEASADLVRGGLRAERPALVALVHAGVPASLLGPLRAEAEQYGADFVALDATTDDALAVLSAHVAEREHRQAAAMV